jgi:hypothetical protein
VFITSGILEGTRHSSFSADDGGVSSAQSGDKSVWRFPLSRKSVFSIGIRMRDYNLHANFEFSVRLNYINLLIAVYFNLLLCIKDIWSQEKQNTRMARNIV